LDRLEALLRGKGITVFARVDHSGEAESGDEDATDPTADLREPEGGYAGDVGRARCSHRPVAKSLAWQSADGKVWLSYNDVEYL
jgi:hypothetical protein